MHLEVHEVIQATCVQGQAHGEVQEGHEAHQIDQHKQEIVLDALRSARSCSGCCTP
jgi:hypothetical protein